MITRIGSCALLACTIVAAQADPAFAQRQAPVFGSSADSVPQTINFTFGWFIPTGEDGRGTDDVLNANCDRQPPGDGTCQFLEFGGAGEFKNVTFGGEWLLPIGNRVEVGAGMSYYKKTVPSIYANFIDSDGTEIEQELGLRQIPLAFTARVLPLGQSSRVQPYVGGGLGVILWRYTEEGEFVDFGQGGAIFETEEPYEGSGTSTGFLFVAGVRFATETFTVGGEVRKQWAEGDLDPTVFAGSRIDLGGWTIQATIGGRF